MFATMFPSLAAMWIFRLLEWTESLLVARLSMGTRGVLEPVLLQMSVTALRTASGNHGRPDIFVSTHFPAFNIVRLWRLTGGFLQKALENLARHSRNRRLVCWFHVQTFDDPDLWQPRGTEVHARLRVAELARSPLRVHAELLVQWGLRLFVARHFCPTSGGQILVEQWELQGYLYGWRIFAAVHKHSFVAAPENVEMEADEDPLAVMYRAIM